MFKFIFTIICLVSFSQEDWIDNKNGGSVNSNCDFPDTLVINEIEIKKVVIECGNECSKIPDCTHWESSLTNKNLQIYKCKLKSGYVTKEKAKFYSDTAKMCGIIRISILNINFKI